MIHDDFVNFVVLACCLYSLSHLRQMVIEFPVIGCPIAPWIALGSGKFA